MVAALAFTSCNSDEGFVYDMPEQYDVAQVVLAVQESGDSQCAVDLTITADSKSKVYYMAFLTSLELPSSSFIYNTVDADDQRVAEEVVFNEAGSQTIQLNNLTSGEEYSVYAVSVNVDGLRTEEVYTNTFIKSATEVMVDTSYSGVAVSSDASVDVVNFSPTLTLVSGNTYTIDTAWGDSLAASQDNPALAGQFQYSGTLTINADNTVTVDGDDSWATGSTTGAYDPCTNTISYTLSQALFGDPTIDVVLTPNNI